MRAVLFVLSLAGSMCLWGSHPVPSFTMRIDDNHSVAEWERVAGIFGDRGIRVSFAVVSSELTEEQGACLRELAAKGHVIMDHTPNHSFYRAMYHDRTAFERAKSQPFVVGVNEKRMVLYFRCEADESHPRNRRVRANIRGNVIVFDSPNAVRGMYDFIMIPGDDSVYGLQKDSDTGAFELRDFWRRQLTKKIDLADVEVLLCDQAALQPCDEVLRELASVARERFDYFGLPRPTVLVRPGGWDPGVSWERLERIYGREFGYVGADSRVNIAFGRNRWSTGYDAMWFFDQGADIMPEHLVEKIQAGLASGHFHVTLSHMSSRVLPGRQEEWFAKTERFVQLLLDRKVPTLTMPESLTARFGEDLRSM